MIKYFLFIAFSFYTSFSIAQNSRIVISDWVNEPAGNKLEKPLIFVDFWATWCIPCIHSMPHTELLEEEFGEDVLFLLLAEESPNKVKHFMEKYNKNFYSAVDNSKTTHKAFNVYAIPYGILLDNRGKLIWSGNPLDLNRKKLQCYVNKYHNTTGLKSRIHLVKQEVEEDHWLYYTSDNVSLQYIEKELVSNNFSVESGNYYFSGDVKQIVSMIYNIPLSSITCDSDIKKKFIIKCSAGDYNTFIGMLERFLQEDQKLLIERNEFEAEVYILEYHNDVGFLDVESFNFEKGNNSYLADDMDVTIDNASIKEMVNILTDFSGYRFIYKGNNQNRYDWKIHYKFIDLTLEQIESELNFSIRKENVMLENIHISNPQ